MLKTAELAGFFAAHAVWSMSEGEVLVPILGFEQADGTRSLLRLMADELQEAVAQGEAWLGENPEKASRAVLVFDGYITLKSGKIDALVIKARRFSPARASFTLAIPYRPASHRKGFAVHRPKFLEIAEDQPVEQIGEALFRGVDQHEQGASVWNAHLDESL